MDQTFQRIDGAVETWIQYLDFLFRERLQHVVRGILMRRRPADADFQPDKLCGAERFDHRLDAVVPSVPARLLDPQAPRLQIEIVVNENEIVGGERELAQEAFERRTGDVHPVEGAGEFEDF